MFSFCTLHWKIRSTYFPGDKIANYIFQCSSYVLLFCGMVLSCLLSRSLVSKEKLWQVSDGKQTHSMSIDFNQV